MQIHGISPIPNSGPGLASLNQPATPPASSTRPAQSAAAPASSPKSAAPASSAPAAASAAPAAVPHGGGAGSSASQNLITTTYSTTVAGKSYSGSIQQEPVGGYIASVPDLPGASASGSSLEAAENNLGTIIDALA